MRLVLSMLLVGATALQAIPVDPIHLFNQQSIVTSDPATGPVAQTFGFFGDAPCPENLLPIGSFFPCINPGSIQVTLDMGHSGYGLIADHVSAHFIIGTATADFTVDPGYAFGGVQMFGTDHSDEAAFSSRGFGASFTTAGAAEDQRRIKPSNTRTASGVALCRKLMFVARASDSSPTGPSERVSSAAPPLHQ